MPMVLEGIKVIELAAFAAGPFQGTILGDYGAEVIKIERPGVGDPMRAMDLLRARTVVPIDFNCMFENASRNKKSVGLNLKSKDGQEIAYRLIKQADVFLTNVEIVELEKFNMTYEVLSKLNPRLVYAHSSAYGHKGPDATKRGFDLGSWARSGAMLKISEPGCPPPLNPIGLPDLMNATFTALGIILALYDRERTGKGQMVTNSIFGSMMWSVAQPMTLVAYTQTDDPPKARTDENNPLYNRYKTKDGRWLILLCPQSDNHWHDICEVLNIKEMENDPRYVNHTARVQNHEAVIDAFDRAFASKTLDEWIKAFEGKNIIWSVAQTFLEAAQDPQSIANDYIVDFDHPARGKIKLMGLPFKLHRSPPSIRTPAPELGENTEEVLLSLGYSWEEIARFKDKGAIT